MSLYEVKQEVPMTMELKSPAFSEGKKIPLKYTCNGEGISPALKWTGMPEGTQSLMIETADSAEINGSVNHWLVYSIPADVTELEKGIPPGDTLPNGAKQGSTAFPQSGYNGPCPKTGDSAVFYHLRIYAVDKDVDLAPGATRDEVMEQIDGHILAGGALSGKSLPGKAPAMTY
jgi:Raf kinase inhibitor-like YbhB/YbcL family protein